MEMKCELCKKTYLRPSKFKKHKLRHTCSLCGIFELSTKDLEKHKETKHTNKQANIHEGLVRTTKAGILCTYCDYITKKKGDLNKHEVAQHAMKKCKKCDFTGNKKQRKAHKINSCEGEIKSKVKIHKDSLGKMTIMKIKSKSAKTPLVMSPTDKIQGDSQQRTKCFICLINFPLSVFEDHKKACFYFCPECPYKTQTIFGLNNHLGSHKDTQQVECEMCLTTYPQKSIKGH